VTWLLGICTHSIGSRRDLRAGDLRGRLEAAGWWYTGRRRRLPGLLLEQRRQVGLRSPHGFGDLDHDALVEGELIALVQLVAILIVRVAEEVAPLVVHHDAAVEEVEFEVAILPFLLLLADVGRVQAAKLCDRRGLRGGQLRVRGAAGGSRHRACRRALLVRDMGGQRRSPSIWL
jgi:hypothetical protein